MLGIFRVLFGKKPSGSSLVSLSPTRSESKGAPFIDVSRATRIALPRLPTINEYQKEGVSHSQEYWESYNKAQSHYGRGWYEKAKEEFLKIYDNEHGNAYFSHLLRTYRQGAERFMEKKKYEDALREYTEMFIKCPNTTNTDAKKYNKLIELMGVDVKKKELTEEKEEPEFICESQSISFLSEAKKPKGFKIEFDAEHFSQFALRNKKQTLTPLLPHIVIDGNLVRYADVVESPKTSHKLYRIKTVTVPSSSFMFSTEDLQVYLSDWQFNELKHLDASRYTSEKYHLRCVDMSGDLSAFIFTIVDECYLLDGNFKVRNTWRVPYKIDTQDAKYKKETRGGSTASVQNSQVRDALNTLGISKDQPTTEDVKQAFRQMTKQYHPDKYKGEDAEDRTKAIIGAYELIKNADLQGVNAADMEDEYWMEVTHTSTFNSHGFEFTLEMGMMIDPTDWIYATGMAKDGSRIYLGCYSGKVYSINAQGVADVVYVIPNTEPISEIMECGNCLHISTHSQLYVVQKEQRQFLKAIQLHGAENGASGYVKYHEDGFVHVLGDVVTLYDCKGEKQGAMNFAKSLKSICVAEGKFVFETANKLYLFG
jgi:hypothetical protein